MNMDTVNLRRVARALGILLLTACCLPGAGLAQEASERSDEAASAELKAELEELRGAIAVSTELRIDLEAAERDRDLLTEELVDAERTISSLQAELDAERESNTAQRSTAASSTEELSRDLESALERLARTEAEEERLAEQLNDARAEIARLESAVEQAVETDVASELPAEAEAHATEVGELLEQIAAMRRKNGGLAANLSAAEGTVAELRAEVESLQHAAVETDEPLELLAATAVGQVELDAAQARITELESALESARRELAHAEGVGGAGALDREQLVSLEEAKVGLQRDLAASEQARAGIWARMQSMLQENVALKSHLRSNSERAPRVADRSAPAKEKRPPYQEPLEEARPPTEPTAVATVATVGETPRAAAAPVVAPPTASAAETVPGAEIAGDNLETPAQPISQSAGALLMVAEPMQPIENPDAVVLAVTDWADAWSSQDVERYLSYYSPGFRPDSGMDRGAWEDLRRDRVSSSSSIVVEVHEITTQFVAGDRAITTFVQDYASDQYSDRVTKTIHWVRDGGAWKIESEVSAPLG